MSQLPPTTRIGGGTSARTAAVMAALVLIVVAGVAVIGRAPAPSAAQPSPNRPAAGTAATPGSASPAPPSTAAPPTAVATPFMLPTARPGAWGDLAAVVALGARREAVFMEVDDDDRLRGVLRLSFPRPATEGTLQLVELWSGGSNTISRIIASFRLPLDPLVPETRGSGIVLDRTIAAHPELIDAPRLVRDGYSLTVLAEGRLDTFLLRITIEPGVSGGRPATP